MQLNKRKQKNLVIDFKFSRIKTVDSKTRFSCFEFEKAVIIHQVVNSLINNPTSASANKREK